MHRSLDDLVGLMGVAFADVFRAAMTGVLGPARVDATHLGTILLAPTDEELVSAFPEFGTAYAAARAHWPVDDTVNLQVLRREIGLAVEAILTHAKRGAGVAVDAVGGRYVRRSDIPESATSRWVDDALRRWDPDGSHGLAALERSYWCGVREATRRTKLTWTELRQVAPVIEARAGVSYAWVGQRVLEDVQRLLLGRAVARYCEERSLPLLAAGEFRLLTDAARRLHEIAGLPGENVWSELARAGQLHRVRAPVRAGVLLTARPFVHVPDLVWNATVPRVARDWWRMVHRGPASPDAPAHAA